MLAIALEASDAEGILIAVGFLIGGTFRSAGYIGMNVSVRANARVARRPTQRGGAALQVAFWGGRRDRPTRVGLGLFGVAGYYGLI